MAHKPFQVTTSTIGLIDAHKTATGEDRYAPIPLTEEWLLKFGFQLKSPESEIFHLPIYSNGDLSFVYQDGIAYTKFGIHTNDTMLIQYVHTFQNACFVLSGKELELQNQPE